MRQWVWWAGTTCEAAAIVSALVFLAFIPGLIAAALFAAAWGFGFGASPSAPWRRGRSRIR